MGNELDYYGRKVGPDIRVLSQMRNVVYDRDWLEGAGELELYYMYRGLYKQKKDLRLMEEHGLRYDITVIPPGMLGVEYTKTYGHYHPEKCAGCSFTELYSVLEGRATYLLQRVEGGKVLDVYHVDAKRGDNVLIPPNYGHITINASREPLKMANWVCNDFSSEYREFDRLQGGAYFLLESGWKGNERYGALPALRELGPTNYRDLALGFGADIYDILYKRPESLEFLTRPEGYGELWERVLGLD